MKIRIESYPDEIVLSLDIYRGAVLSLLKRGLERYPGVNPESFFKLTEDRRIDED